MLLRESLATLRHGVWNPQTGQLDLVDESGDYVNVVARPVQIGLRTLAHVGTKLTRSVALGIAQAGIRHVEYVRVKEVA